MCATDRIALGLRHRAVLFSLFSRTNSRAVFKAFGPTFKRSRNLCGGFCANWPSHPGRAHGGPLLTRPLVANNAITAVRHIDERAAILDASDCLDESAFNFESLLLSQARRYAGNWDVPTSLFYYPFKVTVVAFDKVVSVPITSAFAHITRLAIGTKNHVDVEVPN
jgi:hypothetical protein